jgi:hypothetical protein
MRTPIKKPAIKAGSKITLIGPGWDAICNVPRDLLPAPAFGASVSSCCYLNAGLDIHQMYYYYAWYELKSYHYYEY